MQHSGSKMLVHASAAMQKLLILLDCAYIHLYMHYAASMLHACTKC